MSLHLISKDLTVLGINPESRLPEVLRNTDSGQDYLAVDRRPFFSHYDWHWRKRFHMCVAAVSLAGEIFDAAGSVVFTFEGEPTEAMLQLGHGFVERGPIVKCGIGKVLQGAGEQPGQPGGRMEITDRDRLQPHHSGRPRHSVDLA